MINDIKPTRPINMSTISTTLEISLISLVTPSDSPQVPNADMTSKNTCKNVSLPFSVADIIADSEKC